MHYTVELLDLNAHLFRVSLALAARIEPTVLKLPVWIPGSYLVREFSRHIVGIRARAVGTTSSRSVALTQTAKNAWTVAASKSACTVSYEVYAHDMSVRTAWLDAERGFFNGSSLFLYSDASRALPCSVELVKPQDVRCAGWQVATSLQSLGSSKKTSKKAFASAFGNGFGNGFGKHTAANYDELIDKPVVMGEMQRFSFTAHGTPHELAVTGAGAFDSARVLADCKKICEAAIALFEPTTHQAPFKRYLFMLHCTADSYGGLEHRDSTALIAKRQDLPRLMGGKADGLSDGYVQLLGLISHEYFHSWNVKRIRPLAFEPYDLERENLTRLLWLFEGFTSYYDDLLLLRAGCVDEQHYFKLLAKMTTGVLQTPGRLVESAADASYNAWIKLYRADENTPNSTVSYYPKGALIALALDLQIRAQSPHSLDSVMRHLWQRFQAGAPGVAEDAMPAVVLEATGVDISRFYADCVLGTKELPLAKLLASAGVEFDAVLEVLPDWGGKFEATDQGVAVKVAYSGGALQRAGLAHGDTLIAVNGEQVNRSRWEAVKARLPAGKTAQVHYFRDAMLQTTELKPQKPATREWRIWRTDKKAKPSWPYAL